MTHSEIANRIRRFTDTLDDYKEYYLMPSSRVTWKKYEFHEIADLIQRGEMRKYAVVEYMQKFNWLHRQVMQGKQ